MSLPSRSEARDRVLRATVATLASSGFAATTARAIAATGGFAPGVIYYHFEDLPDLFLATLRWTSEQRISRYSDVLASTPVPALASALRSLYAEDTSSGHVAAVQELVAGAARGSPLAAQVLVEAARWEELAASVLTRFLGGTPFEGFVSVMATAAMAFYLGLETLSHLDGDRTRSDAMFDAMEQGFAMVAGFFDS